MLPKQLLPAFLFLAACASAPEAPLPCDTKCDDTGSSAALLDCWVVHEGTDDFFATDTLHCRYQPEAFGVALHSLNLTTTDSQGGVGGHLFRPEDAGQDVVVQQVFSDKLPLGMSLKTNLAADLASDRIIGEDQLRGVEMTGEIPKDSHFTEQAPLSFESPFELWEVEIINRQPGELVASYNHQLSLPSGDVTVEGRQQVVDFGFSSKRLVAVSRDSLGIEVNVVTKNPRTGAEIASILAEVSGSGAYLANEAGLEPAGDLVEPQGAVTGQCSLLVNGLGAVVTNELRCTSLFPEGIEKALLRIVPNGSAAPIEIDWSSGQDISQMLDSEMLPAEIEVVTTLAADVIGTEGLARREHSFQHRVDPANAESTSFSSFLPFQIWTIGLSQQADMGDIFVLGVEVPERSLELGQGFATGPFGQQVALTSRATRLEVGATLRLAVPAGATEQGAELQLFSVADNELNLPVVVSQGDFLITPTGIEKLD